VGRTDGLILGTRVGSTDGSLVGDAVGSNVGTVGMVLGSEDGILVGI